MEPHRAVHCFHTSVCNHQTLTKGFPAQVLTVPRRGCRGLGGQVEPQGAMPILPGQALRVLPPLRRPLSPRNLCACARPRPPGGPGVDGRLRLRGGGTLHGGAQSLRFRKMCLKPQMMDPAFPLLGIRGRLRFRGRRPPSWRCYPNPKPTSLIKSLKGSPAFFLFLFYCTGCCLPIVHTIGGVSHNLASACWLRRPLIAYPTDAASWWLQRMVTD